MTKFEILVSRGNLVVHNSKQIIEAKTRQEAEAKAIKNAEGFSESEWDEVGDIDYNFQVEEVTKL